VLTIGFVARVVADDVDPHGFVAASRADVHTTKALLRAASTSRTRSTSPSVVGLVSSGPDEWRVARSCFVSIVVYCISPVASCILDLLVNLSAIYPGTTSRDQTHMKMRAVTPIGHIKMRLPRCLANTRLWLPSDIPPSVRDVVAGPALVRAELELLVAELHDCLVGIRKYRRALMITRRAY
jgi:hypothetical protein